MADTLLSFGLEKLLELLVQESARFRGVDKQFTKLKSEVETLRGFLKDADAKKHTMEMVKNTVKKSKEIVYDAEDITQTFVQKKKLCKTSGIKGRIRQLVCAIADRREISLDMEDLSEKIAQVNREMQSLGIEKVIVDESYMQARQEKQKQMRQTFASDTEDHLVGLEKNVEKLVGHMVDEGSSQVVSITGMGGLGKTTLAKEVFNHEAVKRHFEGLVWVCVSQQFSRDDVWRTILRQLSPECRVSEMGYEELQAKIRRVLEEQKALIVLDDIWREEDWKLLEPMLPRKKKGWKVLTTSRIEDVTLQACSTVNPDFLTFDESWSLFRRIAFPSENTTDYMDYEEMKTLGKQMVHHCGGLPLAVKLLGGLLAQKYTLDDWKRISKNIRRHIVGGTSFNDRNFNSVHHVLSLSFEELPIYLKHCFLYLGQFPEDYAIDVGELSYYWAAEGIPKPEYYKSATIGVTAYGYIEELVKRNMVISKRDTITSRFETCHLHDTVRESCLRQVEEENFVHIIDTSTFTSTETSSSPCKSRRLAIHSSDHTIHMEGYIQNQGLRSFLFIKPTSLLNWMASGLCFTKLQLMRVLDLSRAKFEEGKLPSGIGKLIHLRYLSLYKAHVSHLPSSMRNLKLLIYLNLCVAEGSPIYMSNFLKELEELRYLSLPLEIQDKTKLEYGNLTNLETLENFSTKQSSVTDLQRMTRLRTLSILLNGEGCSMETLSSSLGEMQHLQNLTMSDPGADKKIYILDIVHHKQLKRIQVKQHFLSHLTNLSLRHCCLEEDPMPILEKLRHLKEVGLGERSFCGRKIVCSTAGFPRLQMLTLYGLVEWEEWIVEEGSMPVVHSLSIHKCQKLKELPDGLRFITSLKELTVATDDREFTQKFSTGGEDYYKVQHIPLLSIPVFDMYSSDEDEYLIIDHMVYGH